MFLRFRIPAVISLCLVLAACELPQIPPLGGGPDAQPDGAMGSGDAMPGADQAAQPDPAASDAAQLDLAAQDVVVNPAAAQADIGPAGGSVGLPSGAQVTIPAGALPGTVLVSVASQAPPTAGDLGGAKPVGAALVLGPEGQTFLQPVQIRVPLDKAIAGNVDWAGAKLMIAPKGSTAFVTLDATFGVDEAGAYVTAQTTHFSWVVPVLPAPGAVFVMTESPLPAGTVGKGYGPLTLSAAGGMAPYTWSLPGTGMPPGFDLSPQGVLSGMPSAPGSFGFAIRCADAAGTQVEKAFQVIVGAAKPAVTWIQPPQVPQGSAETVLSLTGTNFAQGSVAYWKSVATPLPTVYQAADKLQVTVQAPLLVSNGNIPIFVKNPDGTQSASYTFQVTYVQQNPQPKITSLQPNAVTAGATDTQVSVLGSGFVKASMGTLGEQGLATQYVSASKLLVVVPAGYLTTAKTLQIQVFNPEPGGGYSLPANLLVQGGGDIDAGSTDTAGGSDAGADAVGTDGGVADTGGIYEFLVFATDPKALMQFSGDSSLALNGAGFQQGCQVVASTATGPQTLTASWTSANQVVATVPAALLTEPGDLVLVVKNPDGKSTAPVMVKVQAAIDPPWGTPTLQALTPASTSVDAAEQILTVKGQFLAGTAQVFFDGKPLQTVWKSGWQLDAILPTSAHPSQGQVDVYVQNPVAAGGKSAALPFAVTGPGNPVPWLAAQSTPGWPTVPTSPTDVKLTFEGYNFLASSQIRVDGQPVATVLAGKAPAFVLEATLPAAMVAVAGVHTLDAFNPGPGGGASNSLTLTVVAAVPKPTISSLAPSEVRAGSWDAYVMVWSAGNPTEGMFLPGATAQAGTTSLTVQYLTPSQLIVTIPNTLLKSAATLNVVVTNPGGSLGSVASAPVPFKVVTTGNAVPGLSNMTPTSAAKDTASVQVTVNGSGFLAWAPVYLNGKPSGQSLTGGSQFKTTLTAAYQLGSAGPIQFVVANPAPGGGFSKPLTFTVTGTNPLPALETLTPSTAGAGTGDLNVQVLGSGFGPATKLTATVGSLAWPLKCNDNPQPTGCWITIPSAFLAQPGEIAIAISNPAPGGGTSNVLKFLVEAGLPTPQVTSISPYSLAVGAKGQTLTIAGSGFSAQSTVADTASGTSLSVTQWTATSLQVALPDALLAQAATLQIVVSNPPTGATATGGGTAPAKSVKVMPQPLITALDPPSVKAGTVLKGLKILGNNLNLSSYIQVSFQSEQWAQPVVVSSAELQVDVPAMLTAAPGKVPVTVLPEGYGASNTVYLDVVP